MVISSVGSDPVISTGKSIVSILYNKVCECDSYCLPGLSCYCPCAQFVVGVSVWIIRTGEFSRVSWNNIIKTWLVPSIQWHSARSTAVESDFFLAVFKSSGSTEINLFEWNNVCTWHCSLICMNCHSHFLGQARNAYYILLYHYTRQPQRLHLLFVTSWINTPLPVTFNWLMTHLWYHCITQWLFLNFYHWYIKYIETNL